MNDMKDNAVNDPVYIIGHLHPDTDSVASAIAYAFFKRAQGVRAIPCRLGDLNQETRYLLQRFHLETPMLLKDARKTISEIDIDPPVFVYPETTVFEAVSILRETQRNSVAVLHEDHTIAGFISRSDLANIGLGDTAAEIELLKHTDVSHLAKAINGSVIYDDPNPHINGKVSIVALSQTKTMNYEVHDRIVIVGDDPDSQKNLIEKGAGALIVVWTKEIAPAVLAAARKYHCPIVKSGHGSMNTTRYLFLAPPVKLIMKDPMLFHQNDLLEEAGQKMMKTRYRDYPVTDSENRLVGYISRYHIMNYRNKKLILVDHNEFSQSVRAVEKGQILEVIDHHRINDFATSQPVSFRNEIVGSTATIITTMFRENQIPLPKEIAGILLGAVLSDTLMFQSPTTTQKDRDVANILAAVADVEIETFSREMFTAGSISENMPLSDQIVQDIKYYEIDSVHTMISQVLVPEVSVAISQHAAVQRAMETLVRKKGLDLLVVAFTSIVENGSVLFSAGEKAEKCQEAFPDTEGKYSLQKDVLSRKLQILPRLTKAIEG